MQRHARGWVTGPSHSKDCLFLNQFYFIHQSITQQSGSNCETVFDQSDLFLINPYTHVLYKLI